MSFFSAAEGIGAPALVLEGDHWKCLVRMDEDTVALASHRGYFCIVNVRSNEGHAILDQWQSSSDRHDQEQEQEMQYQQEVLEMQFCARTGQFWTLERNIKRGELELVCYKGAGSENGSSRRTAVPVSSTEATMCVSRNGTVTLSLAGGIIEIWHCRLDGGILQQVGRLKLTAVLGISTQQLFFNHVLLLGPLLVVSIPTDIWLIQLDGFGGVEESPLVEDSEATDEEEEGDENKDTDGRQKHQSNLVLGELEDREDMLDCALPRYQECVMAYPGKDRQRPNGGGKQKEEREKEEGNFVDLSASSMVVSRLSYHRPRYMVSEVKLLSAGETWVELLVVAGRSACLYRVTNLQDGTNEDAVGSIKTTRQQGSANGGRGRAPEVAVLIPLAEIGFNTNVLATAKGNSPEFPWVYFLTLSGIEIWCLPPPGHHPRNLSPCRLVVQRLEYRQRLDRLPPIGMVVVGSALVLLANPPGHTPPSLPNILFHTVPRPSPERIPELSSLHSLPGSTYANADGAFGIGYDLITMHAQSVAAIYGHLRTEVKRTLSLGKAVRGKSGGMQEGDDEEEDQEQDFLATRFVEGELLDSSVYGIQPEHVIHQSGAELLRMIFALLRFVAITTTTVNAEEVLGEKDIGRWRCQDWEEEEKVLKKMRIVQTRRLYANLAKDCASLLGWLWLEPRAEGVQPDLFQACGWFAKSSIPVLTICSKLLALWGKKDPNDFADTCSSSTSSSSSLTTGSDAAAVFLTFLKKRCRARKDASEGHFYRGEEEDLADGWEDDDEDEEKEEQEDLQQPASENKAELARSVSWPEVLTLGHDLGGEDFLAWVVFNSNLISLPSCKETIKRILLLSRGTRKEELLSALAEDVL